MTTDRRSGIPWRWGFALLATLLCLVGGPAFAEPPAAMPDEPPSTQAPPAAPVPPADTAPPRAPTSPRVPAPGTEPGVLVIDPAPDVRPRPPEPPPPGAAVPDWDRDFRSRGMGLGPPLPPPDPFDPRPIRYRHDIREVTLDGRMTPVKRVPPFVDVVERRDLIEYRPFDLGDFARRYPNVMIGDGGSPVLQMPIIRGLGGNRVRVLTDGVWPAAQPLGFHGTSLSLWDPESTERMEIYHGPGAYLKGIDSPGGMINIVPRRPRRHDALSADVGGAVAYDSATRGFRGRAEADIGQERVAGLGGVTWTTRDDRWTPNGTLQDTSFSQLAADLALDYFVDNRSRIGITAQYMNNYDVRSPTSVASDLTKPSFERIFLALTVTSFDMGGIFSGTKASVALDSYLFNRDEAFAGTDAGLGGEDDATRFDFNLQGNLYIHPCHDTWAELTFNYAHLDRTERILSESPICPGAPDPGGGSLPGGSGTDMPAYEPKSIGDVSRFQDLGCSELIRQYEAEEVFVSLLIEDQYHSECWDTQVGLRLDWYHIADNRVSKDESQFLVGGSAGVVRHVGKRSSVYANASAGWRRPTTFERHSTAVLDGITIFGNPDLDTEFHVNAELGVRGSLKNRVSYQVSGFGHWIQDYIGPVWVTPLLGPTQELTNLGDVWLYGAEATGAWRPWNTHEGAELYASAGVTLSSDELLVADVPLLWRAGTRYSVPTPRGYRVRRWFADAAFYGATDSRDGPRGGKAFVTGEVLLGTGIDLGDFRNATFNLGVTNLLNQAYTPPASRLPAPGVSFMANLSVDL